MLRFEGRREFSLPPSELFGKLTDPRFLVECVPGVESTNSLDADRALLILRPGFSFVRGTLEVTLQILDRIEPTSARVQLLSKGIGSSSEVEATLTLSPRETGSQVHWTAEVKSLGGLLKMVPAGLIRGAAENVINEAWDRLTAKIEAKG